MEKKLNHLENRVVLEKLTDSIEKTLESKIKSYVNNLMRTTMENVLNKQLQTMSHQFNERFDILEEKVKAELKPGITNQSNQWSQKASIFEVNEHILRTASDTQIRIKEIENILKQLNSRVQGGIAKTDVNRKMISAVDTKLTNNSNAMNRMEDEIKLVTDKIDQGTTKLKIIEKSVSAVGPVAETWMKLEKMEEDAKFRHNDVSMTLEKFEDPIKLITDKVDRTTAKLEAIEESISSAQMTQMIEQLEEKVEQNKDSLSEKLEVLHVTLQDIQNETENCSNSTSNISHSTAKSSKNVCTNSECSDSKEIINETKNNLLKVCNSLLRKITESNKAMTDAIALEELEFSKDDKEYIQECCDTLLKNIRNDFNQFNTLTRDFFDDQKHKIDNIIKHIQVTSDEKNELNILTVQDALHNKMDTPENHKL